MQSEVNFDFSQENIDKLVSALEAPLAKALLDKIIPVLSQIFANNEDDKLSSSEVQRLLGIKPSTFYKWRNEGKIKDGVRVGKQWFFPRREIEQLLVNGYKPKLK